jgi:MYXO-CTERM domain-containing protein
MKRSRLSLGTAGALGTALGLIAAAGPGYTPAAHACGCFAPPDPTTPIVQAGERILFAMQDGVVTAHIQIQYDGNAEEFAWLVPMPAVPTLALGTDELFTQVIQTTQPRYRLMTDGPECPPVDTSPGEGGGFADAGAGAPDDGDSPVVTVDSIGPYDYAVLEADSKQPMLDWLSTNRYFVPAGTEAAVDPYIRPGGYFLALKLKKGQSVGDLQPIVVKYQSQLPQIPIVLTGVAADPDMPVLVWVLGDHRAIPRNFFHTQVNDALIDWGSNGSNYIEVVTAAVDEANGHHSFITEYAGTSNIMVDVLDPSSRFGDLALLRTITEPADYLDYLWSNGFGQSTGFPFGGLQLSSQILTILERDLPIPQALIDRVREDQYGYELAPADFYVSFRYYEQAYPDILTGAYPEFDPATLTGELETRIVLPTRAAGQLFRDHPYLTRLFTTLSPDEMTRDPTFSFNPDLPEVSNVHLGQLTYLECSSYGGWETSGPAIIVTEQGWRLYLPNGLFNSDWAGAPLPASYRIEMLREEGAAQVVTDNTAAIGAGVDDFRPVPPPRTDARSGGCNVGVGGAGAAGSGGALLLLLGGLLIRRRARKELP